jgi:hypothetical protein
MSNEEFYISPCELDKFRKIIQDGYANVVSWDTIKAGDVVYTIKDNSVKSLVFSHFDEDGRVHCYDISTERFGSVSVNVYTYYKDYDVFDTIDKCKEIIEFKKNAISKCDSCKYDKYSLVLGCKKCKNRIKNDNNTHLAECYCKEIFDRTGLKIDTFCSSPCKYFVPKINNGDWIDFDWYMEVLKNCWCWTDDRNNCAKAKYINENKPDFYNYSFTTSGTTMYDREMNIPQHIKLYIVNEDNRFIYFYRGFTTKEFMSFDFIENGKIRFDKVKIWNGHLSKHKVKAVDTVPVNKYLCGANVCNVDEKEIEDCCDRKASKK